MIIFHFSDVLFRALESGIYTNSTANYFTQAINHAAGSEAGTFEQRYYMDTSYCKDMAACPIFMYIGGEGTLSGVSLTGPAHVVISRQHHVYIILFSHFLSMQVVRQHACVSMEAPSCSHRVPRAATPGGYTATLAQEHGALILALEHRW